MKLMHYQLLVILIVFTAMLFISTDRWQQREEERDEARHLLIQVIPEMQERLEVLRAIMIRRELDLLDEYDNMMKMPPVWPEPLLTDEGEGGGSK